MELTYGDEGMSSQFILMTIGELRGASQTPAPNSKRPASRQPLEARSNSSRNASSDMPPPPASAAPSRARENSSKRITRPSPPPPQPSIQSDQLFVPAAEGDARYDPMGDDDDDDQMLLWDVDVPGNNVSKVSSYRPEVLIRTSRVR